MRKMYDCKNIVRCDDVRYIQHENGIGWDIYIKMELLIPLMRWLPASIPESTVLKIAKDMCTALVHCQKFGVVHRDIKPQNIFVASNGEYKLGDFGIAKTVEKTMGGTKIGTYKYMAPEVYNNQPYGSAADQYSLGLVLYWMLNDRRMPFLPLPPQKLNPEMEREARERRLAGEQLPLPAHGSKPLQKIVLKACSFDPKDRYSSAQEMLDALETIGTDCSNPSPKTEYTAQRSVNPYPVPDRRGRKKKWTVFAGVSILLIALLAGGMFLGRKPESQSQTNEPTQIDAMEIAAQHASEGSYLRAIQVLDEEWKRSQDPQYLEAMAQYRLEFGVYNTSVAAAGKYNTALLLTDGTVMVSGDNSYGEHNANAWTDIVAVSAGDHHIVGLRSDGTVVAEGNHELGRCDVGDWENAVAAYAADYHTLAVFEDGSVKAVGKADSGQCDTETLMLYKGQEKIVAVSGGARHTLALLGNGRVLSCGDNFRNACNVSGWTDIAAIYAGSHYSVGLKTDGTIVTTGLDVTELNSDEWTDLVNLAAGDFHIVGLKSDGTIVSALLSPDRMSDPSEMELWNLYDIVHITAGHDQTVAVGLDGTVWCLGSNEYGQCDFSGLNLNQVR